MNLRDLNPCLITARRLPFSEGELYVNQLHLRLLDVNYLGLPATIILAGG